MADIRQEDLQVGVRFKAEQVMWRITRVRGDDITMECRTPPKGTPERPFVFTRPWEWYLPWLTSYGSVLYPPRRFNVLPQGPPAQT